MYCTIVGNHWCVSNLYYFDVWIWSYIWVELRLKIPFFLAFVFVAGPFYEVVLIGCFSFFFFFFSYAASRCYTHRRSQPNCGSSGVCQIWFSTTNSAMLYQNHEYIKASPSFLSVLCSLRFYLMVFGFSYVSHCSNFLCCRIFKIIVNLCTQI